MLLLAALILTSVPPILLEILSRALRTIPEQPRATGPLPAMVVIRPVRGLDAGLEENVRAALRQRYPGELETLFVLDDASDPATPVIQRVIESEGADARVVFSGSPPPSRTGKLHAMIHGLAEARRDAPLVCFADSDTRPAPGLLADLAAIVVASRDVGAAFARAIGTQRPATAGDVGYGLLLDGLYGPQAALAMRHGTLPFIMGQTMVLRRAALAACGGLEGSHGELVDDMHIGARMAASGRRNVLAEPPVAIVQRALAWSELRAVALRWLVFGRTGVPLFPFNVPAALWVALYVTGLVGAGLALAQGEIEALVFFLVTSASVVIAVDALRREQGGAPLPVRLWWAPFVCFALVPWWWLQARFAKTIVWRGRTYALDAAGRLGAEPLPESP